MSIAQQHREIRAVLRGHVLRIFNRQQIISVSVIQQRAGAAFAKHREWRAQSRMQADDLRRHP